MRRLALVLSLVAAASMATAGAHKLAWLGMAYTWLHGPSGQRAIQVQRVTPGGPAESGGIRPGDVIVTVNDIRVDFGDDLDFLLFLQQRKPGERVTFGMLRGGRVLQLPVLLGTMPESALPKWELSLDAARRQRNRSEAARR